MFKQGDIVKKIRGRAEYRVLYILQDGWMRIQGLKPGRSNRRAMTITFRPPVEKDVRVEQYVKVG